MSSWIYTSENDLEGVKIGCDNYRDHFASRTPCADDTVILFVSSLCICCCWDNSRQRNETVHLNLSWHFCECEYVNRLTGCWEYGILLSVTKGNNWANSSLVDDEVVAYQFVFMKLVLGNYVTRMCALFCHSLSSATSARTYLCCGDKH